MATTDLPLPVPENGPAEEDVARSSLETVDATSATVSMSAVGTVNAETLSTAASAIATAKTGPIDATGCAIGLAQVDGDAAVSLSVVPILSAKGGATFRQSYASAFVSGGDVSVSQGGAPLIIAREVNIDTGGGVAVLTSEATIRHSWIGVLLARRADVSDDTRVFLNTRGALILAAALLGGFGIIAIALYFSAKSVSEWRPNWPSWMQHDG